jgi:hypothetical protein
LYGDIETIVGLGTLQFSDRFTRDAAFHLAVFVSVDKMDTEEVAGSDCPLQQAVIFSYTALPIFHKFLFFGWHLRRPRYILPRFCNETSLVGI